MNPFVKIQENLALGQSPRKDWSWDEDKARRQSLKNWANHDLRKKKRKRAKPDREITPELKALMDSLFL